MPTKRLRRSIRKASFDCERTRIRLESGHDFSFLDDTVPLTDDELREAWEALRDDMLPAFISDNAGARPYAWHRWDSPTPVSHAAYFSKCL
jgi:hypothetical protein